MRFLIASLALLISAGFASSQTEKLSFRTLAVADANLPELWVAASGKAVSLSFSSKQPSAVIKADKTSPFKIYKGPLDDKGKPTDASPTLVELPANSPSFLLLGWVEEEKPRFLAIADSLATVKSDDWLVINHSKKALNVKFGQTEKSAPIVAKSAQIVKCSAPAGEGMATIVSSQQEDGSWKDIYSSYLPIYADKRGIIVVVENDDRIRVNYISDEITRNPAGKR